MQSHPNRRRFEGCLTVLDRPSDGTPVPLDYAFQREMSVTRKRVLFPIAVAAKALDTLIGQPLSYRPEFDGHSAQRKCGVINEAHIDGDRLMVSGEIWPMYCPEFVISPPDDLGMSYELVNAAVKDMEAPFWTLTSCIFIGAAVLLRTKGACRSSSFRLLKSDEERIAA